MWSSGVRYGAAIERGAFHSIVGRIIDPQLASLGLVLRVRLSRALQSLFAARSFLEFGGAWKS